MFGCPDLLILLFNPHLSTMTQYASVRGHKYKMYLYICCSTIVKMHLYRKPPYSGLMGVYMFIFAALVVRSGAGSLVGNCLESCSQISSCSPTTCVQDACNGSFDQTYQFCRCDEDCSFFGDCCQERGNCNSKRDEKSNSRDWQCSSTSGVPENATLDGNATVNAPYVLMVRTCDSQWSQTKPKSFEERVRKLCEYPDSIPTSPVTSNSSGVTYANQYCAQCNYERPGDLVFWVQQYACPKANSTTTPSLETLLKLCTIFWRFLPPPMMDQVARPCIPTVISVCPSNYTNTSVVMRCRQYSFPVTWRGKTYKNKECALCNGVTLAVPLATCARFKLQGYSHTPQELDKARLLFNGCYTFQGFNLYGSAEVQRHYVQSLISEDIDFNCSEITSLCLSSCSVAKMESAFFDFKSLSSVIRNATNRPHYGHYLLTIDRTPTNRHLTPSSPVPLYITGPSYSLLLDVHNSQYSTSQGESTVTYGTVAALCNSGEVFLPGVNGRCAPIVSVPPLQCIPYTALNMSGQVDGIVYVVRNRTVLCSHNLNSTNASCIQILPTDMQWAKLVLTGSSVENSSDGYIGSVSGGQVFKYNQTILFCSNLSGQYDKEIILITVKTELGLVIATYIGSGLSILGSCILLFTYTMFRDLRTFAGKLVMNLSAAILISDVVLIGLFSAAEFVKSNDFCVATAVLLHYTFLTRFSWMSVIAVQFAVVSTNPFSSNKFRVKRETLVPKTMLVGLAIGWGLPFVIVVTCVGLNFSLHDIIGYGRNGKCWISDQSAHIGAFIIPVFLSVLLNFICFTISIVIICCSRKGKNNVSHLRMFIALSSLMGVTWLFGFVAISIDNTILWYIFIVLNSTQGLFVSVMMICKRRIYELYRSLFVTQKKAKMTKSLST